MDFYVLGVNGHDDNRISASKFQCQPILDCVGVGWKRFTEVDGNAIGRRHYRIPVAWQSREALRLGRLVARPKRFELLTPRFVVWCSIQLSYGRVLRIARETSPEQPKPLGTGL